MARATKILRNFYRDSVSLMQLSSTFAKLPGVEQASAIMASANNLSLLREAGLLTGTVEACANDLLIAPSGDDDALAAAMAAAESALNQNPPPVTGNGRSCGMTPAA